MADDLLIPVESESRVELEELLAASGLEHAEVMELVQFGVFETSVSAVGLELPLLHDSSGASCRKPAQYVWTQPARHGPCPHLSGKDRGPGASPARAGVSAASLRLLSAAFYATWRIGSGF